MYAEWYKRRITSIEEETRPGFDLLKEYVNNNQYDKIIDAEEESIELAKYTWKGVDNFMKYFEIDKRYCGDFENHLGETEETWEFKTQDQPKCYWRYICNKYDQGNDFYVTYVDV